MIKKGKVRVAIEIWLMIFLTMVLSPLLIYVGDRPKQQFKRVDTKVTAISNFFEEKAGRDKEKYRFITTSSYPVPFEIFVGKDKYDFSPELDKVDSLKAGDSIAIYLSRNIFTGSYGVNGGVYFIDRGSQEIFIRGNSAKIVIHIVTGMIVLLFALIFISRYYQNKKRGI